MGLSKLLRFRSEDMRPVIGALGVPGLNQVVPRLSTEVRRARRYERPLSVLVVSAREVEDERRIRSLIPLPSAAPPALMAFVFLGSFLLKALREEDILASAAEGLRYVIILPEAAELDAKRALRRLQRDFPHYASLRLRAGLAVFPHDGTTVEALLEHAHRAWQTPVVEDLYEAHEVAEPEAREASGA